MLLLACLCVMCCVSHVGCINGFLPSLCGTDWLEYGFIMTYVVLLFWGIGFGDGVGNIVSTYLSVYSTKPEHEPILLRNDSPVEPTNLRITYPHQTKGATIGSNCLHKNPTTIKTKSRKHKRKKLSWLFGVRNKLV